MENIKVGLAGNKVLARLSGGGRKKPCLWGRVGGGHEKLLPRPRRDTEAQSPCCGEASPFSTLACPSRTQRPWGGVWALHPMGGSCYGLAPGFPIPAGALDLTSRPPPHVLCGPRLS